MDNTFGDRIEMLITYATEGSRVDFANKIDRSRQYVNKLLRGQDIGLGAIENILTTFPEISARWLIFGSGDMFDYEAALARERKRMQIKCAPLPNNTTK